MIELLPDHADHDGITMTNGNVFYFSHECSWYDGMTSAPFYAHSFVKHFVIVPLIEKNIK